MEKKTPQFDAIEVDVRTLETPYLARQLLDCLSGKSTRGYSAVEFRRERSSSLDLNGNMKMQGLDRSEPQ